MEGVIRTVIHSSDRYVFRFKAFTHPSRQVFVGGFVEITTADAGLVGDDNDQPAQLVGPEPSQFEDSRNKFELVRPMDVTTVNIDHAVAVKKKCALCMAVPIYTTDGLSSARLDTEAVPLLEPEFLVGQQLIKVRDGAHRPVLKHSARLPIE
jgi:hypothetical protein